jgi:hypothetical protein
MILGVSITLMVILVAVMVVVKPWKLIKQKGALVQSTGISSSETTEKPTPARYYENIGQIHFSYILPEGWENPNPNNANTYPAWEAPDCKCVLMFQVRENGTSAKDAAKQYTDWIYQLKRGDAISTYEILSEHKFPTNNGVEGYKLTIKWQLQSPNSDPMTYFIYDYYLYQNGNVVAAHYARFYDDDKGYDKLIDECVSTFRFEK